MNILAKSRAFDAVLVLCTAANIDLNALLALKDENALKAHIDALVTAGAKPTDEQLAEAVTAEIAAAGITIAEGVTPADAIRAAVAAADGAGATRVLAAVQAAGVKVEGSAKPEQVTQAINDRVSVAAREQLAKHGLTDLPGDEPNEDPSKAPKAKGPELTGLARVTAALEAKRTANA